MITEREYSPEEQMEIEALVDCYHATTPQGEPLNEWLVVW